MVSKSLNKEWFCLYKPLSQKTKQWWVRRKQSPARHFIFLKCAPYFRDSKIKVHIFFLQNFGFGV